MKKNIFFLSFVDVKIVYFPYFCFCFRAFPYYPPNYIWKKSLRLCSLFSSKSCFCDTCRTTAAKLLQIQILSTVITVIYSSWFFFILSLITGMYNNSSWGVANDEHQSGSMPGLLQVCTTSPVYSSTMF